MKTILALLVLSCSCFAGDSLAESLAAAGAAHLSSGRTEQARDAFYQALALDERCVTALMALAKLAEKSDKAEAAELYRRAWLCAKDTGTRTDALRHADKLDPIGAKLRAALLQYARDAELVTQRHPDAMTVSVVRERTEWLQPFLPEEQWPDPTRYQSVIDLIALADVKKDCIDGQWVLDGQKLVSPASGKTKIQFPYSPPKKYEFIVAFKRLNDTGCVGLVAPINGVWQLWYQDPGRLNMPGGPTLKPVRDTKAGESYTLSMKVDGSHVDAFIDGKKVASLDKPAQAEEWHLQDHRALGIGTQNCRVEFISVHLIELDGHGKILR